MVLAGGRALGRHATYSYVHTRAAISLNEHLRGRCGVGVVVIKYETKNDFLDSGPPERIYTNDEEPRMENGGGFGAGSQIGSRGWWWWREVGGT